MRNFLCSVMNSHTVLCYSTRNAEVADKEEVNRSLARLLYQEP